VRRRILNFRLMESKHGVIQLREVSEISGN
jgi:hypothetical protein